MSRITDERLALHVHWYAPADGYVQSELDVELHSALRELQERRAAPRWLPEDVRDQLGAWIEQADRQRTDESATAEQRQAAEESGVMLRLIAVMDTACGAEKATLAADAVAERESRMKLDAEVAALRARVETLEGALRGVLDDEPCHLDHHGFCQTHGVTKPCVMAAARAALDGKERGS